MNEQVGFGIIGAGAIGRFHAQAMQSIPQVKLIGVFDRNAAAADKLAAEFGVRAWHDFDRFLAEPSIQAVTIGVPSGLHGSCAIPAAKAGKHILCEKPLEITVAKADAIIEACRENHCLLSPVFQARFTKPVQMVKKAMRSGRFGRMLFAGAQMHWYRAADYYSSSSWRGTWALDGGGALMNQAIHMMDLLLYINGPAQEVFAYADTLTHSIEVEDTLTAVVKYRNRSMGTIEVSTSCSPGFPRRLEFTGSDGSVAFEEDNLTRWEFARSLPEDGEIRSSLNRNGDAMGGRDALNINNAGHIRQIADLADAILQNRQPELSGEEGRRAVEFICGIYESVRTGKPYRFCEKE